MAEIRERATPPPTWWEEVSTMRAKQADLRARVKGLEEYEDKQNGSLQRMEKSIEGIKKGLNGRLDRLQWWLIGLLGSVLTSLVLLIVGLIRG